jgi:hypothetical protein
VPASRSASDRRRVGLVVLGLLAVVAVAAALVVPRLRPDDVPRFAVVRGQIIGPDHQPFVPVGVNLLGPDAFFNTDAVTTGMASTVRDRWGLNTVRLNSCLPTGCPYTGVHNRRNDNLDALVDEFTSRGVVVILALHQVKPGEWPTDAELDAMDAWWREKAARYRDNTRVWFNLLNEPGSEKPVPGRWLDIHTRLLRTVRATGAQNLVVVDGSQWGQEAGGPVDQHVGDATSAILRWGDRLEAVAEGVVFSFHVYDQWGSPELSAEQREQRLADFVTRVRRAGHAVIIGEVGGTDNECCDPTSLGTVAAYQVASRLHVGLLAWHGQAVDGQHLTLPRGRDSSLADLGAGDVPDHLTWQGQLLWKLVHQ